MMDVLARAERQLRAWFIRPATEWNSLDVDYEPPRVERLWRPFEDQYRVYLHRIHPCEKALMHPHPWPSVIKVISGKYEMGLNYHGPEPLLAKFILTEGSIYVMDDPKGWHYVKPLKEPSLSLMITGKPYEPQLYNHEDFGKHRDLKPLTEQAMVELVQAFQYKMFP